MTPSGMGLACNDIRKEGTVKGMIKKKGSEEYWLLGVKP